MVSVRLCSRTQKNRSAYVSTDKYPELSACASAWVYKYRLLLDSTLCDKSKQIAYLMFKKIMEIMFSKWQSLTAMFKIALNTKVS
jgi:hypothetical protein